MDVDEVRRAAAAIVWEPDFAEVVRADAFTLVKYPMWLQQHCQAHRLTSCSPADDVIDAALARARSWSRDTVWFCGLSSATRTLHSSPGSSSGAGKWPRRCPSLHSI